MKHLSSILLFALALLITSCDSVYDYQYKLVNNTDTAIAVHFPHRANALDTLAIIPAHMDKYIIHTTHGVEAMKGSFFRDVVYDLNLDTFYITRGSRTSSRDFRDNSSWQFTKNGGIGTYTATISDSEF